MYPNMYPQIGSEFRFDIDMEGDSNPTRML